MAPKEVLITGGSGFIGANLILNLLKLKNFSLNIILRPNSKNLWRIEPIPNEIKVFRVDICDNNEVNRLIKKIKPNIIFHLATYGSYPNEDNFGKILNVNVLATINLVRICAGVGFESFVNLGSSSEYEASNKPISENDPLGPATNYGWSKAAAALFCQQFAKSNNLKIATVRPFSVYGPFENPDRLIPTLMIGAILAKRVNLAKPNSVRDFVYVDDVIDALLLCAKRKVSGIFNIGYGREYSVKEVYNKILKISKRKFVANWGKEESRIYEPSHWHADIRLAKNALGWKPKNTLRLGLEKTYLWFGKNYKYYI